MIWVNRWLLQNEQMVGDVFIVRRALDSLQVADDAPTTAQTHA